MQLRVSAFITFALVAAVAVTSGASFAAPKKSKKERIKVLRQRLHNLKASKKVKQQQLRQTKRTQRRLSDQLNDSYVRLEAANDALKASALRLRRAEEAVRAATRRLELAEAKLEEQQDRFGRRIALHYKEGPTTYLSVLLGAGNMSEMLDRRYYVSRVFSIDSELLTELRTAQEAVARERRSLVTRRSELAEAHRDNAMRVQRVAEEANEREDLLKAVQTERALQ
jgi:peptidoglycan hydrolase CwlO-like protein